jgi:hypothetical protein
MTVITILSSIVLLKKLIAIIAVLFLLTISIPILTIIFGIFHYHFWLNEAQKDNFNKDMMFWYK